jgi:hypothetical protein
MTSDSCRTTSAADGRSAGTDFQQLQSTVHRLLRIRRPRELPADGRFGRAPLITSRATVTGSFISEKGGFPVKSCRECYGPLVMTTKKGDLPRDQRKPESKRRLQLCDEMHHEAAKAQVIANLAHHAPWWCALSPCCLRSWPSQNRPAGRARDRPPAR